LVQPQEITNPLAPNANQLVIPQPSVLNQLPALFTGGGKNPSLPTGAGLLGSKPLGSSGLSPISAAFGGPSISALGPSLKTETPDAPPNPFATSDHGEVPVAQETTLLSTYLI